MLSWYQVALPSTSNRRIYSRCIADTIKNEGQVYYNSTAGTMNITAVVYGTGAWASGGNINTARAR